MKRKNLIIVLESLILTDKKRKIHIMTFSENNYKFYNGVIVNYEDTDSLSIVDNKLGYINIPYSMIINIEPYREK